MERKSLQVYRNEVILDNVEKAELAFNTMLTKDIKDGEVLAVRYYEDADKLNVKTLLGLVCVVDGVPQITVYSEMPAFIGDGDFSTDTDLQNLDLTQAILKLKSIIDNLNDKYVQYEDLK